MSKKRLFVAITGASGVIYAKRLIEAISDAYDSIYLTASERSLSILHDELDVTELNELIPEAYRSKYTVVEPGDVSAPPASGSHLYDGMAIVPCSMGTLGRIAAGISNDLITRAADVCLKERRKLVAVIRESPYSLLHIENMAAFTRSGGIVLPASPAFYHNPKTIADMVDYVVDRILQQFGLENRLIEGWKE